MRIIKVYENSLIIEAPLNERQMEALDRNGFEYVANCDENGIGSIDEEELYLLYHRGSTFDLAQALEIMND